MDDSKCKALKADLAAQSDPQIVSIERFFDGNDDLGSIGCNLVEHPGMNVFRDTLTGVLRLPGVEAVYAQIAELNPGEHYWPFTDTVFVVGKISADELRAAVTLLQPDTVGSAEDFGVPPLIAQQHDSPVMAIWWD